MGNKEILANYNLGHLVTKLTATAMSPPGSRQLTRLRVAGEKNIFSEELTWTVELVDKTRTASVV